MCIPYHERDLKVELSVYIVYSLQFIVYTIKKNSRIEDDFLNKDSWKLLVIIIINILNSTGEIIKPRSKETEKSR